jgi:hypothetical protein
MTFGEALDALKNGQRVARAGWNGKGMWLAYVPTFMAAGACPLGFTPLPWIGMKTADGGFVPWLASQTDILADDWELA